MVGRSCGLLHTACISRLPHVLRRWPEEFATHSLRAGFLTSGAEAEASVFKLMEVSRHKSMDTLRGYVRRAELFKDHAGSDVL